MVVVGTFRNAALCQRKYSVAIQVASFTGMSTTTTQNMTELYEQAYLITLAFHRGTRNYWSASFHRYEKSHSAEHSKPLSAGIANTSIRIQGHKYWSSFFHRHEHFRSSEYGRPLLAGMANTSARTKQHKQLLGQLRSQACVLPQQNIYQASLSWRE